MAECYTDYHHAPVALLRKMLANVGVDGRRGAMVTLDAGDVGRCVDITRRRQLAHGQEDVSNRHFVITLQGVLGELALMRLWHLDETPLESTDYQTAMEDAFDAVVEANGQRLTIDVKTTKLYSSAPSHVTPPDANEEGQLTHFDKLDAQSVVTQLPRLAMNISAFKRVRRPDLYVLMIILDGGGRLLHDWLSGPVAPNTTVTLALGGVMDSNDALLPCFASRFDKTPPCPWFSCCEGYSVPATLLFDASPEPTDAGVLIEGEFRTPGKVHTLMCRVHEADSVFWAYRPVSNSVWTPVFIAYCASLMLCGGNWSNKKPSK